MLRGMPRQRLDHKALARETSERIGREVLLARMNLGLSLRAAARLAGVAPETQRRVEAGDPHVQIDTACAVGAAVGLKVWARAFPAAAPTLRDTGQLWIADWIRRAAHPSLDTRIEVGLGNLRAADLVIASPTEILPSRSSGTSPTSRPSSAWPMTSVPSWPNSTSDRCV